MQVRTIDIRGKQYVTVAERVRLAHAERESFEMVESAPIQIADRWLWRVAIIVNGKRYIGTAEVKMNAPKNLPDGTNPFECAETSALGRALGFAGLGSVDSICSAEEVVMAIAEQEAPRQRPQPLRPAVAEQEAPKSPQPVKAPTEPSRRQTEPLTEDKANTGQIRALQSLYQRIGESVPSDINYWSAEQAKETIIALQQLSKDMQKAS
jgi:hypothetical protein